MRASLLAHSGTARPTAHSAQRRAPLRKALSTCHKHTLGARARASARRPAPAFCHVLQRPNGSQLPSCSVGATASAAFVLRQTRYASATQESPSSTAVRALAATLACGSPAPGMQMCAAATTPHASRRRAPWPPPRRRPPRNLENSRASRATSPAARSPSAPSQTATAPPPCTWTRLRCLTPVASSCTGACHQPNTPRTTGTRPPTRRGRRGPACSATARPCARRSMAAA